MRYLISGLVAAAAVLTVSAAPALACGGGLFSSCSPCGQAYVSPCAQQEVYVAPAPVYSGCNSCGWAHERLPDPVQQYYYVNQGPTYSGPGNYAPYPVYREREVSDYSYRHNPYYYGSRPHHSWHGYHHSQRYGYESHHGYGPRFYGQHHSMRYGAPMGMSHRYGSREHMRHYN